MGIAAAPTLWTALITTPGIHQRAPRKCRRERGEDRDGRDVEDAPPAAAFAARPRRR